MPFPYVLPRFVINNTDCCPKDDNITSMYYHVLEHLKEMVGINTETRAKRMILPIVSILSGGLSEWNTVEIQGFKSTIEGMQINSHQLDREIDQISSSSNKLIDNLGQMSILVSDQSRTINSLSKRFNCAQRVNTLFHTFVENWLFSAPSEFLSAYTGSLTDILTPSLLSAKNLKEILLTPPEMTGTLYQFEPSIVYELGKVILTELQVITSAVIKRVIQLPKITISSPLPIYNTYTTDVLKER